MNILIIIFRNRIGTDLVNREKIRHLDQIARILESRKRIRLRFLNGDSFTLDDILNEKKILELTIYLDIIKAIYKNKKKNNSIKSNIDDKYMVALISNGVTLQVQRAFNDNHRDIDIVNVAPLDP